MKQIRTLILFLLIGLLAGCDTSAIRTPLDQIPENYSIEDAQMEICLIIEDYDITYGEELLTDFLKNVEKGNTAALRIVTKFPDEEKLYVSDLLYDKGVYTYDIQEDHANYPKTYSYLLKMENTGYLSDALYVLVNDEDVTWKDIQSGMLSSLKDAQIDHDIVIFDRSK